MSDDEKVVESAGMKYNCATLKDFKRMRDRMEDNDGWDVKFDKPHCKVWTKPADPEGPGAGMNVIKVNTFFPTVDPSMMYDALHDPVFRKSWDDKMIEGANLVQLDERNDIGYYSAKFPFPLQNRDFLNLRSWMEFTNGEYIIMNYSVKHNDCPEKSGFTRGVSYMTGYYLKPMPEGGTELLYITHSDIKGSIPKSMLNSATQKMAPTMMTNLGKNGEKYEDFKQSNHPVGFKPSWRTPKVSWDADTTASLVAGGDASGGGAAAAAGTDDRDSEDGGGGVSSSEARKLQEELEATRAELRQLQHRGSGGSLAPVAPRHADDPKGVQQYRAAMQQACGYVDRLFVEEGRAPSLEEYLTRLHAVVDGMRRTAAPGHRGGGGSATA